MHALKKFWFCFYLIAMVVALFGPGWMLISSGMVCFLLIIDSFFLSWYKAAKQTIDMPSYKNSSIVKHKAFTPGVKAVVTFKFCFSVFFRSCLGIVAIFIAFANISEKRLVEILPIFPSLESDGMAIKIMWACLFALILVAGIILSSMSAYVRMKMFSDKISKKREYT